jgi:hypothetical protein
MGVMEIPVLVFVSQQSANTFSDPPKLPKIECRNRTADISTSSNDCTTPAAWCGQSNCGRIYMLAMLTSPLGIRAAERQTDLYHYICEP